MIKSFLGGRQKELLGTLSKSGRQGRILLDRSVGDHSVPAAPAVAPTILQVDSHCYISTITQPFCKLIWIYNYNHNYL